jgi:hypothetical protein
MFSKIVLTKFPNRLTVGFWRMGRLHACQAFLNNEAGQESFKRFLLQHNKVPIYLIIDAAEEDYHYETLPHVTGKACQALAERRLGQLYRNVTYRAASKVGREKDKRRDDIYLFQALNSVDNVAPWVQVIEELHAPLAGVYLLPMVSEILVNQLKLVTPHMLLTDWQGAGLRQTYFLQGRMRVSRLVSPFEPNQGQLAELCRAETSKTRLYLLSQRLIARDTNLRLLILGPGPQIEEVSRHMDDEPGVECLAIGMAELGRRLGLDKAYLQNFPELLYMQVLAKGWLPVNLAPEEQRWRFLIQRIGRSLWISCVALLSGGFLAATLTLLSFMDYRAQTETEVVQTRIQQRMYDEVARNFPSTPLSGKDLRMAVEISETIAANAKTPLQLMQVISASLDNAPEILLQRLRWKLTTDINSKDDISQAKIPANQGTSEPTGTLYEIGFLDGEIGNFQGDYRSALNNVNRFSDLIRNDPRVEQVLVVQQPVNVSSQTSLQGSTLDAAAQQIPAAQFKLKIILKPEVIQP